MANLSALTWSDGEALSKANLNRRAQEVHSRLVALEEQRVDLQDTLAELTALSLERVDETIEPAITAALGIFDLGAYFTANSPSTATVATGEQVFVLPNINRDLFAPTRTLLIYPDSDPLVRMEGVFESYDKETGTITVNVVTTSGSGTYSAWTITPAVPSGATQAYVDSAVADLAEDVDAAVAGVDEVLTTLAAAIATAGDDIVDLSAALDAVAADLDTAETSLASTQSTVASLADALVALDEATVKAGTAGTLTRLITTQTSNGTLAGTPDGIYVEDTGAPLYCAQATFKRNANRAFQLRVADMSDIAIRRFHSSYTDGISDWWVLAVQDDDVSFTSVDVGDGNGGGTTQSGVYTSSDGAIRLKALQSAPGTKNMVRVLNHDGGGTLQATVELRANGDVYSRTGTFGTLSDQSAKTDIADAPPLAEALAEIPPRVFRRVDAAPGSPLEAGLVIQDTNWSGMPEPFQRCVKFDASAGAWTLNTSGFAMVQFAALNELIHRVKVLEEIAFEREANATDRADRAAAEPVTTRMGNWLAARLVEIAARITGASE
ncbi:hypothetical protein ATO13_22641 [Stappia sp. 22II-S9-Z10]|nr:hypothetical protein ATO13_22641 [Stappia sp. 22II-S9-Z10]